MTFSRHAHVGCVVLRSDPQAQQVGAPLFADLGGQHHVAERFRHRPAVLVERPAVREHLAVGRAAAHADANQQRAVEPAAILVRAFEVHVRGPGQFRVGRARRIEHRQMRRAGIEPDVENVVFLAPARGAAMRSACPAEAVPRACAEPGVGAFLSKPAEDVAQRREVFEQLAALRRNKK